MKIMLWKMVAMTAPLTGAATSMRDAGEATSPRSLPAMCAGTARTRMPARHRCAEHTDAALNTWMLR